MNSTVRATSLEPQWTDSDGGGGGGGPENTRSLSRDRSRPRLHSQIRGATTATNRFAKKRTDSLPTELRKKANVNQDVNPFVEFPSLRRGFTLNGQPIAEAAPGEKQAIIKVKEESSAFYFWAIYLTLVILAVGNLITTAVIINVLRINGEGMEAIEFLPGGDAVRFFGDTDLGEVYKHDGIISGFAKENLEVSAEDAEVIFQAGKTAKSPKLTLAPESIKLENVHDLNLLDPHTGEVIFSTSDPELDLPSGLRILETEETEVEKISSPVGEDMMVRSDRELSIRGAEGIEIEGRKLDLTSSGDILLKSEIGSVELSGGVVLDTVMLPHGGVGGYQGEVGQYKLCVCMPSGLLFKVAIPDDNPSRPSNFQIGCHSVDLSKENPCSVS